MLTYFMTPSEPERWLLLTAGVGYLISRLCGLTGLGPRLREFTGREDT